MSKNVLISGVTGFVGSNVLTFLLDNTDWNFTAICSWRHVGGPSLLKPNKRVRVITHDLTEPLPDLGQFDYILNIASESHVDRSIADPVNFIENNVSSTLQMLEYARQYPPKIFLQFSTDEVYGTANHQEWDILLPSNPYAASKAAQEVIAISYWRTYKVPVVITSSNNIIGPNQNPEKFIPKVIDLIKNDQEVTIHISDNKPGKRNYNSVQNIASALMFILNLPYKPTDRPEKYAIPGGEELDNLEMAKLIAKLMGKELKFKLVDAQSVRPGYDQSYDKLAGRLEKLGWKPAVPVKQELERIIND